MDEVLEKMLHPVKSRRLIEGPAQHAYDLVERVINRPGQTVVDRVALAVVRAGMRVLPPPEHLHVIDDPMSDGRKRRDACRVDALPEALPVLVDALGRMMYILRINWR